MSEDEATTTVAEAPPAGTPAPPVTPPTASDNGDWSVETLPAGAQKMIRDLRAEAAANRTKANDTAAQHQASLDAIAKALGLKDADDPAAAAKTAADERDAERARAKALSIENAVLKTASKHGAVPEALTDSRSFMAQLEAIDPAAEDFNAKLEEAIKAAVETNPALKSASAVPSRSGGPVGGGAEIPGQLTAEDVKTMTTEERLKAKAEGRFDAALGIRR